MKLKVIIDVQISTAQAWVLINHFRLKKRWNMEQFRRNWITSKSRSSSQLQKSTCVVCTITKNRSNFETDREKLEPGKHEYAFAFQSTVVRQRGRGEGLDKRGESGISSTTIPRWKRRRKNSCSVPFPQDLPSSLLLDNDNSCTYTLKVYVKIRRKICVPFFYKFFFFQRFLAFSRDGLRKSISCLSTSILGWTN